MSFRCEMSATALPLRNRAPLYRSLMFTKLPLLLLLVLLLGGRVWSSPSPLDVWPEGVGERNTATRVLRIAADPNNLPFSNERREGFENQIAGLLARELKAELQYTWRAQRRGFFRETLKQGNCDLVMGVPAQFDQALTTIPYYRSSYVFVSRTDKHLGLHALDDPALRRLR